MFSLSHLGHAVNDRLKGTITGPVFSFPEDDDRCKACKRRVRGMATTVIVSAFTTLGTIRFSLKRATPESDARFGSFDFRAAHAAAPADLQELLDQHESLPFRRRGYERDGMLKTVVERAGERAQAHTRDISHRHSQHHFPTSIHPQASKSCSEPPNQAQTPRQRCSQQCLPK